MKILINRYKYVNNNPSIRIRDVAFTNDPFIIAQMPKMVAINSAIEKTLDIIESKNDKFSNDFQIVSDGNNGFKYTVSDNALLTSLKINGYNIKFSKDVFEYNLGTIKSNKLD